MQEPRTISTVPATVTRAQAMEALEGAGLAALWRRTRLGILRSVADVYVPFALQKVALTNGRIRGQQILAVDAVSGNLDPYEFAEVPHSGKLAQVRTINYLPSQLSAQQTRDSALAVARRQLYSRGFFRLRRDLHLQVEPLDLEVFIPYWVGFFGANHHAELIVMDAVRGQIEGAKVEGLLRSWIRS